MNGSWRDAKLVGHAYTRCCGVVFFSVAMVREKLRETK